MDELATKITKRQYEMENVRQPYESLIQNAVDYINPRRYDFQGTKAKGQLRKTKMYDGTAQDAFHTWVNGILGWYVSRSQPWIKAYIPHRTLWKVAFSPRYVLRRIMRSSRLRMGAFLLSLFMNGFYGLKAVRKNLPVDMQTCSVAIQAGHATAPHEADPIGLRQTAS